MNSFAGKAKASLSRVGTALRGVADSLVTPMTGLVLGGGFGYAVKGVGDLSQQLMYYGMAAKKSKSDTEAFRKNLHQMAVDTGVDANTILGGISKIGEVTGDFAFSENMGAVLAKTSKASAATVDDLASVAAAMKTSFGWGADEIGKAFNSLIIQGDQGSYTLQKFAAEGKALLASASSFGIKSADQFASFGGYLQVMNTSIKSEAELTTSVSALFSELIAKSKDLSKIGVHVFDKEGNIRDFDDIMRELMEKTNGDIKKIVPLFGDATRKALVPVAAEYKNGWKTLDTITQSGVSGMTNTAELEKRYEQTASDFNTNIAKMKASATQFVDMNLAGPVDKLSTALSFLAQHQAIVSAGFKALVVAVGALAAVKIADFVGQIRGLAGDITQIWKGKGKTQQAAAEALDSVQKVFVTNLRGGMGGGDYYDDDVPAQKALATEAEKTAGKFSKFRGGLNSVLGSGVGFMALGAATAWASGKIMEAGSLFMEWRNETAAQEKASADYLRGQQQAFEDKHGKTASTYGKQVDEANLAIQKEESGLFGGSDRKLKELYLKRDAAMELMRKSIQTGGKSADDAYLKNFAPVDPSKYFNQNITIRVDAATGNGSVTADKGKAPKLHTTKPFNFNGGN